MTKSFLLLPRKPCGQSDCVAINHAVWTCNPSHGSRAFLLCISLVASKSGASPFAAVDSRATDTPYE